MAGSAQWRRAINDLAAQYGGTVELTGDGRALRNTVALVRREAAKTCANGQH